MRKGLKQSSKSGFSLIEVIVALAVAATMIISYVSLAERSLAMVDGTRALWENINYSQELLGIFTFTENDILGSMYNQWDDRKEAYWRLSRQKLNLWDDLPPDFGSIVKATDKIPDLYKYIFETRLNGYIMTWEWYYR